MPEKYFDCEYKLPFPHGNTAFFRAKHYDLSDWSEENIGFLSMMMKMAFNDGLLVGRAKVKEELKAINKAIDVYLENVDEDEIDDV